MSLTRFAAGDKLINTDKSQVSTWTNNVNNLTTAFTSSLQNFNVSAPTSSVHFYINTYQTSSVLSNAEIQYAVAYGNKVGSGSIDFTHDTGSFGKNAARVIYGQYRNLVFGDETQNFTFGTHVPDDIYVINVNRARYRQGLKPGTLNLHLSSSMVGTTLGTTLKLTDDSVTKAGSAKITNIGRQFNIVSGASGVTSGSNEIQIANSASYGLFYPDAGIIILNCDAFGQGLRPDRNAPTPSNVDYNNLKMHKSISASGYFIVDSEEKITSQFYFVRAKNMEYNYSQNPSYADNTGNLNYSSMINNPVTYITTVGLYNDSNDLIAVAKLSQPIVKDFTKEALIRVKLDY
jgi:hypothetical protein